MITPEQAKQMQMSGHPAGAWFDNNGKPRNTITCTICSQQVEVNTSALINHLDDHGRSWPKRQPESYVAEFTTQADMDGYLRAFPGSRGRLRT